MIFTREGDWYRDIYPRRPLLYLRPCRSRRRRFVWISLTVSRTRHGGWKRKKSTDQQFVGTTANERAVTCKVYRRSSVFNEEWVKAWSFYRGTFFLSFFLPESEKKERKKKKKEKKGINANESILWNVSSHISEMMIIHRNNSRSVALKVIPRNWVS